MINLMACSSGAFQGSLTQSPLVGTSGTVHSRVGKLGITAHSTSPLLVPRETDGRTASACTAPTYKSRTLRSEFLGTRRASLCSYSWCRPSISAIRASASVMEAPGSPRPTRPQRLVVDGKLELPGHEGDAGLPQKGSDRKKVNQDYPMNGFPVNGHCLPDHGPMSDPQIIEGHLLQQLHQLSTDYHHDASHTSHSTNGSLNGHAHFVQLSTPPSEPEQSAQQPKKRTPQELEEEVKRLAEELAEAQVWLIMKVRFVSTL
jgi:hypothetical protein